MTDNQNNKPVAPEAAPEEHHANFLDQIKDFVSEDKIEDVKKMVEDNLGKIKDEATEYSEEHFKDFGEKIKDLVSSEKIEEGKKAIENFAANLFGKKED